MARSEWALMAGLLAAGAILFSMTGCAAPSPFVSKAVCPPIIEYTAAQEHQAGSELVRYLPPNSEIEKMLTDYRAERNMLRACAAS